MLICKSTAFINFILDWGRFRFEGFESLKCLKGLNCLKGFRVQGFKSSSVQRFKGCAVQIFVFLCIRLPSWCFLVLSVSQWLKSSKVQYFCHAE